MVRKMTFIISKIVTVVFSMYETIRKTLLLIPGMSQVAILDSFNQVRGSHQFHKTWIFVAMLYTSIILYYLRFDH